MRQGVVYRNRMRLQKVLSDNIKRLRSASGMSQKELADASASTQATVSKWEKHANCNVTIDKLDEIANALDVTPATLLENGIKRSPKESLRSALALIEKALKDLG